MSFSLAAPELRRAVIVAVGTLRTVAWMTMFLGGRSLHGAKRAHPMSFSLHPAAKLWTSSFVRDNQKNSFKNNGKKLNQLG